MVKIFISYRRKDDPNGTDRIYEKLAQHFGRDALFMDIDDIPIGIDYADYLDQQVRQCDILLAMIGDRWLDLLIDYQKTDKPDLVQIEIASALNRDIPVIPVLLQNAAIPAEQDLPDTLAKLARCNAAEVRPGKDFRDHVKRLIRGIEYWLVQGPQKVSEPKDNSLFTNSLGMQFAFVPKGTFWMSENNKNAQKQVEIKDDFYMGIYQVTQQQWQAIMGNNPSYFSRTGYGKDEVKDFSDTDLAWFPVEQVSWEVTQEFIKLLNEKEKDSGWLYRLPTEAEWEYACRGGGIGKNDYWSFNFYFDRPTNDLSSYQANFNGTYPYNTDTVGPYVGRTTKVGSYQPNELGLYDMHGNVWELCQDWYKEGSSRVIRGGSWSSFGGSCQAANRGGNWCKVSKVERLAGRDKDKPPVHSNAIGFRLVAVPSSNAGT